MAVDDDAVIVSSTSSAVPSKRQRSSADSGGQDFKLFRCGDCDKSYSRVDHLSRHVRQHTQERPYICDICTKSFARADLLRRHRTIHNNDRSPLLQTPQGIAKQARVIKACQACASVHVKCDNEKPCSRCRSKNTECRYGVDSTLEAEGVARNLLNLSQARHTTVLDFARDSMSGSNDNLDPTDDLQSSGHKISSHQVFSVQDHTPSTLASALPPIMHDDTTVNDPFRSEQPLGWLGRPTVQAGPDYNDITGHDLRDFLMQVMGDDNPQQSRHGEPFSGTRTPWNLFDMSANTNLELNDLDFDLLQDYNHNLPFPQATPFPDPGSMASVAASSPQDTIPSEASSHRDSTWRYRPASNDNIVNNLSLPANISDSGLGGRQSMTIEPLTHATRDQILAMMVAVSTDTKFISSFPSVELLDSLLQYFFSNNPMGAALFHAPTFRPIRAIPMLVAGMIAAGAVIATDPSLRKFGFALQEATRVTMSMAIEKDNSLTRDLSTWQTYMLGLDMGLWSGNSRKMEISEGFILPFVTMLRRSGCFARTRDNNLPSAEDSDNILNEKWHRWIAEESRRRFPRIHDLVQDVISLTCYRLVFDLFRHDTHASISLFINPSMSYAELALTLPWHRYLWRANTARKWREVYLSHQSKSLYTTVSRPSTLDLLQDLDKFVPDTIDFDHHVATQTLICAAWGLVREYRQQHTITGRTANQWASGTLLLSSRLTELKRLLQCIHMGMDDEKKSNTDLLGLEILHIHLQMSLEQVHRFAGIEGPEQAKRAYPDLREWVQTDSARQAILHAGAILRYAHQTPSLRAFNAVAIYQAALALWSYGIVLNGTASASDTDTPPQLDSTSDTSFVVLNGDIGLSTQRFVALNRGFATIQFPSGGKDPARHVRLSDPPAVMRGIMDILTASYTTASARPPLVDNLLGLIDALRAAATTT